MAHLEEEALAGAWLDYKTHGELAVRNELILHYSSLVRYIAMKVSNGLPSAVERDDLISYGTFGLMDAIEKYDLDKGIKFETYAVTRIKGSIIDGLRALDWAPRGVRTKARNVERAQAELHAQLGRPAEDGELAAHLGLTVPELWAIQAQTSTSYLMSGDHEAGSEGDGDSAFDTTFDVASNPEDLFAATEVSDILADAIQAMPERSKIILTLYYLQEMTLAEIGEVLGVTESRVCQLQSKVLQSLRDALGHGALVAA